MLSILSEYKARSSSGWQWKVGAAVTVSVAFAVARRYWSRKKLERKLEKKRALCRQTLKQMEDQVNQHRLPPAERDAIVPLPLSALQAKLQKGELKAVDVLRAYQDKALELNARTNCVVEAIPEAQEQAASCDRTGDKTRLLHGVPVSVKENIAIKGYDVTAGLQININVPSEEDAILVEVLKRHGAIPFVRTNVPQALLSITCSNPIFGVTTNPHNTAHAPGGSSGGEGAILGGGASIIGLGTDVGGSVRFPAAFCGVYSLKPTLGRFSTHGCYSVNKGRLLVSGVAGPMARDVDSLVTMTRVMTSPDMFELDSSLPPVPFQEQLFKSSRKLRIGYYTWDGHLPPVPAVVRAARQAKAALEALGHTVVEFTPPDYVEMFYQLCAKAIIGAERAQSLRNAVKDDFMDAGLKILIYSYGLPHWVISLMARTIYTTEPVLSRFLRNSRTDGSAFQWFQHVDKVLNYRRRFAKEWKTLKLDAVICPVFPCPAPKTEHAGNLTLATSGCVLYNTVNFPAGVMPVTKVTRQDVADVNNPKLFPAKTRLERILKESCDQEESVGLPVAVQCVTLPFQEELCLRVMKELETALDYSSL